VNTTVVIFSFNRGPYLANAVASIRRNWPTARVLIMDDNSDDKLTLQELSNLQRHGAVVVRPDTESSTSKRGLLHRNMQQVWDRHLKTPYALYMQDDQQIVRRISVQDEERFQIYFNAPETPPFLHVVFPRCVTYSRADLMPIQHDVLDAMRSSFDRETYSFHMPDSPSVSETGLWDVQRATAAGWAFAECEAEIFRRSLKLFGAGRMAATPFLAFLPTPLSFRNRKITLTRRLYFALTSGLHPIDDLTEALLDRLLSNIGEPPLGDWYLHSTSYGGSAPWPSLPMSSAPPWLHRLDVREQEVRSQVRALAKSASQRLRLIDRRNR